MHLSQVTIEMDIFTVCWPAIVNIYDKISKMIIIEESEWSAKNLPEFLLMTWSLKRMLLGQYFCLMLLSDPSHGGRGAEARKIITPIIQEAVEEEAERRTAVVENREPVRTSLSQITIGMDAVESLQKSGATERSVLIFRPLRKSGETIVTIPGKPARTSRSSDHSSSALKRGRAHSADEGDTSYKRRPMQALFKWFAEEQKQSRIDHRDDPSKLVLVAPRK